MTSPSHTTNEHCTTTDRSVNSTTSTHTTY